MNSPSEVEHAMRLAHQALDSSVARAVGSDTLLAVRNGLLTIPAGAGAEWYDVPVGRDARPESFPTRRRQH